VNISATVKFSGYTPAALVATATNSTFSALLAAKSAALVLV